MKASVPDPLNGAGRSSTNGRFLGLKKSTLSMLAVITVGTPLLVACDNLGSSIPVNTEVSTTPAAPSEQTPAPTTSEAPAVETSTSKAPKPEPTSEAKPTSTKETTTSAKPTPPTTSQKPAEPVEPEVDFEAIQQSLDSYLNEAEGGVARQELINALTAQGYSVEHSETIIDKNNILWFDEVLKETELLLNGLESPSRHSLRDAFSADANAALFTADEVDFAVDTTDWQAYAVEAVHRLNDEHNPSTRSILEQLAEESLVGFSPEEIETGIDSIDWVSKDRQLIEEFLANEPGGQTEHETMAWLESHGYSEFEAMTAVYDLEIDWLKQAEIEAHYHLEGLDSASRTSLRDRMLFYDAWTFLPHEVDHAIEQIDWQPYATQEVLRLNSEYQPYSRSELLHIISWELDGFTETEIETAVDAIDWNAKTNSLVDSFFNDQPGGKSYLEAQDWLIQHGYSYEEATSILDELQIDWKEQAALEAQLYLADNPWASRVSLANHLVSNEWSYFGFTDEEISYAMEQIDWQPYATKQIDRIYEDYRPATKSQLLEFAEMELEGFTDEELDTAANQYDWAAKERALIEGYQASVVGGQAKNELIEWLGTHGYSFEEAESVVESLDIDWKEQAFLEIQTFERWAAVWSGGEQGLRFQFEHSPKQYTAEEVDYAIEKLNVDWVVEGTAYAESLLRGSGGSMRKEYVVDELRAGGLTEEEIESVFNAIDIDWNEKLLKEANSIIQNSGGISEVELRNELPSLYDGFIGRDEVVYALENVTVDWNEQALERGYSLVNHPYRDYSYYDIYDELTRSPISFTHEEAEYAQEKLDVDWVGRAIIELDRYLQYNDFSKTRAFGQIEYEGYTTEQTQAAVDSKPAELWRANAVRTARVLLRSNDFSRDELIRRLNRSDEFTLEEAEYAADQVGLTE